MRRGVEACSRDRSQVLLYMRILARRPQSTAAAFSRGRQHETAAAYATQHRGSTVRYDTPPQVICPSTIETGQSAICQPVGVRSSSDPRNPPPTRCDGQAHLPGFPGLRASEDHHVAERATAYWRGYPILRMCAIRYMRYMRYAPLYYRVHR